MLSTGWRKDLKGLDIVVDAEQSHLPFRDLSVNTVLNLFSLEHTYSPHRYLDEAMRIAKRNVVIALPNNYAGLLQVLLTGRTQTRAGHAIWVSWARYGLPVDPPEHGQPHRWFFHTDEAVEFVEKRAILNGYRVCCVLGFTEPRFRCLFSSSALNFARNYSLAEAFSAGVPFCNKLRRLLAVLVSAPILAIEAPLTEVVKIIAPGLYRRLIVSEVWFALERSV